ncbi:MAG: hypothetical protein M3N21_07455, partial [Actinomycetota bacterium]|nr:hypothetical protein [Actinomycetota bacterium]
MKSAGLVLTGALVAACTPSGAGQPAGALTGRAAALHAAASCIRAHGVPTYQDPVLSPDGHVFTDARSIQDADGGRRNSSTLEAIRSSCASLIAAAGFSPADEAPAPISLVQAGVKAAQCLRANGLPSYHDPTSSSPFTPGHGFGLSGDELPNNGALGKADPTLQ